MNPPKTARASALSRLNRLPVSAYHRKMAWILGFVFLFDQADVNTLSFTSPAIMKFWGASVSSIAVLISATFFGMFFGSTLGGWLSDRIGRRKALIYTTLWYSGFSLLNAFAWNMASLFLARLLTGVGISAMTVIGIAYISEIFPAKVRGGYQGWIMVMGLSGIPITAYVARFCIPLAPWGWRLVFVWGAIGILFPLLARSLEESPQWYENQGRFEEADAVLDRIEATVSKEAGPLPPVPDEIAASTPQSGRYLDLLTASQLPRTVLLMTSWVFIALGFFGFTSWVPTLLVAHGFSMVHSLAWSSGMSIAAIPGALIAALISDRWDRKWLIAAMALVIAVFGVLYGLSFRMELIIAFGVLVEMFIHAFTPMMYAYTAESFPSAVRNSGTGLAYGAGRLANVFGPLLIAFLFNHYGYASVFIYIAATWVLVSIIIAAFGPRSRTLA